MEARRFVVRQFPDSWYGAKTVLKGDELVQPVAPSVNPMTAIEAMCARNTLRSRNPLRRCGVLFIRFPFGLCETDVVTRTNQMSPILPSCC